jgi:Uma2 family endonuclease
MLARQLAERDDNSVEDQIVVLHGATWADYQRLLEIRGEKAVPRLSFLEGKLEIITPSRRHESIQSRLGCLVEVWCLEKGVEFSPYGSWTLEKKQAERGLEPDECYVFGQVAEPERPDLAIEVVWTTGGVRKLDIYSQLGVREVWYWRRQHITVHVLDGDSYREQNESVVLPGIDLVLLVGFLDRPTASQAMREYRAALSAP